MPPVIGYARTSTIEQEAGLESQHRELGAAGATKLFSEQISSIAHREKLEAAIESGLHKALGYAVTTFIRSTAELAALARMTPFGVHEPVEGSRLYVGMIKAPLDATAQQKLSALISAESLFHTSGREVFWLARKSSAESDFSGAIFEKAFKIQSTWRNINTIHRMAAQFAPGA